MGAIYFIAFIWYAREQHRHDGHKGEFDTCQRHNCKRARQLEIYLILTSQWGQAAIEWATMPEGIG